MSDAVSLVEALIGLTTLASILTGASAYFFKVNTDSLKEHTDATIQLVTKRIEDTSASMKQDFKEFSIGVNDRFEKMYMHMDDHKKDLNSRLDRQIDTLNNSLRELSRNIEKIKDDVHSQEKSFLQLRIDISEKFATKEELERLEKQVENIQINI